MNNEPPAPQKDPTNIPPAQPPVEPPQAPALEQPLVAQPTPQPLPVKKKHTALWVVLSIVGGLVLLGMLVAVILFVRFGSNINDLFSDINSSVNNSGEYDGRLKKLEAENKTFGLEETMQYGPMAVKVVSIDRDYQLSAEEIAAIDDTYGEGPSSLRAKYGLDDPSAKYVQVKMEAQYDVATESKYDKIAFRYNDPFITSIGEARLNNVPAFRYAINDDARGPADRPNSDHVKAIKTGEVTQLTYVFAAADQSFGEFTLNVNAFTQVSPVVGTEGMPSKNFTYKLIVW